MSWYERFFLFGGGPAIAIPAALLLLVLIIAWQDRRTRKRAARGLCTRCGYDLTGNVSGTCPECGKSR